MSEKPKIEQPDSDTPEPVDEGKPRRVLPDVRDPEFIERYRRQHEQIANSKRAREEMEWWERLQTDEGWV